MEQRYFEFGGYYLDTVERRLLGTGSASISLSSRAFDVLQYLVQHPGEIVAKDALMAAVWPNTIVEENNLNQAVAALRKALGETPDKYRFILTIPGRGYRFVSEVRTPSTLPGPPAPAGLQTEGGQATTASVTGNNTRPLWLGAVILIIVAVIALWVYRHRQSAPPAAVVEKSTQAITPATPPAPEKSVTVVPAPLQSVAVLPFADMSANKDQEYFADGVAEEVLNQLSRIHDLFVVGRTSSFSFKGKNEDLRVIGEKLSVSHILEGSVRKEGNRIRVSAQLVKAADGYHLWSQKYDRDLGDIFVIQDDISKSVANSLEISLGVGELGRTKGMTRNVEAYDEYLAGRSQYIQLGRENMSSAIEHLENAVTLDPNFAAAWSTLASVYLLSATSWIFEKSDEYVKKSINAENRAIAIDPETVASLIMQQRLHVQFHDWIHAEESIFKAHGLAPADYQTNQDYGIFLSFVGRPREAIEYRRRAVRSEPLSPRPYLTLGYAYEMSGDLDAAMTEYERVNGFTGGQSDANSFVLVLALTNHDRALIDKALEKFVAPDRPSPGRIALIMRPLLDEHEKAITALYRMYEDTEYNHPLLRSSIAIWASFFGDDNLALQELQEASKSNAFLFYTIWRPIHKHMRRLPGFKDLVRDLKLVDYWRATGKWGDFCRPLGDNDFECK